MIVYYYIIVVQYIITTSLSICTATTGCVFTDRQTGLRAKGDFRVKPCSPTKMNVTILHFIITGKTPPE